MPGHRPHPECPDHTLWDPTAYRFRRKGLRQIDRVPGLVRRFQCLRYGRTFSSSAFFDCYRCRHAVIPEAVFLGLCEGQAARQALLVHLGLLRRLAGRLRERVGLDGLRTSAGSQWEPGDLNTTVGSESTFVLDVDDVGFRRSGAMTPRQRRLRTLREKRLGRPDPRANEKAVRATLRRVAALLPPGETLLVDSDEEPSYHRAVAAERGAGLAIEQRTINSKVWRQQARHPLWAINHEHRVIRHASKNHGRETIAFSKTAAGLMDRAWIYVLWRNTVKGISERHGKVASETTPAMRLGLTRRRLEAEELFHRRLFPRRVRLPR